MPASMDKCFEVVMKLVKECGQVIRESLKKSKNVITKSSEVDFVTETDRLVEEMLTKGISLEFPDHRFIGEESVSEGAKCELTDAPTWIIDPIDGTMNFVHSNPNICISIALLVNKKPEIGIIYSPVLELMYWARAGQGAFLNNEPIRVSGIEELSKALVVCEMGTSRVKERYASTMANLEMLIPQVHGLRASGSAAMDMCSVAAGWTDAFYHAGLHCWDIAAGDLIVREAKGIVIDIQVRSSGSCALNMAMIAAGAADMYYECGIHAWDIAAGDIIIREAGGTVIDLKGGPFDVMSRRVLCASSRTLAEKLSSILHPFPELPRD